jgi:hypothetical protein
MELDRLVLDFQVREKSVELAKTHLDEVTAEATPEASAEAQAALESAGAAAADARAAADLDQRLAAKGYLSAAQARNSEMVAKLAGIDAERARLALERVKAGASKEARETARLELESAGEALAMARADAERRRAELDAQETDAQAAVANLRRSVNRARLEIALRETRAEADGVVIYRDLGRRTMEKPEVGSRAWPGAGVMDVADLSSLKVRAQLAENYIRYLGPKTPIRVLPDAVPGAEFRAQLTWVDRWSRDRSADLAKADREREGLSGVKVFTLEAEVLDGDARIRPGFRGKVEFLLAEVPDATVVPRGALYGSGGARYVRVSGGGAPRKVSVEVLAEGELEAAVRGELSDGQALVTRAQP